MANVYSVGQINYYIKNMFAQDYVLKQICIKGEVSNCKYHTSGHIYFTLKDETGTLACVMFAGNRNGLKFKLEEGQKVLASGSVSVYERDGKYQLYAKSIELDGLGDLYRKFEEKKRELAEMGMFDDMFKQKIPAYPKAVGIVTASTGAAVQDIIHVSTRRDPFIQLILYPAQVQGEGAAASIVKGLQALDAYGVDVIIAGRGGGSIEDLWAFNEEIVARAIFDCQTPVISAVGHETDWTIADYVADLRAPTPSAAAELAVGDVRVLMETIGHYMQRLTQLMQGKTQNLRSLYKQYLLRLEHLSPMYLVQQKKQYSMELEERLKAGMEGKIQRKRQELSIYIERLKGLSPLDKLNQGYSYVAVEDGKTLCSVEQVKKGDQIFVHVGDGNIQAEVEQTKKVRRKNDE